ncbi:hypothetical protein [Luteipulveratus mongoliensis]|uniref:Integral membrane protein n=1 Tax=Luteipulveratus mongoliensis TaxID=571913 RepID=A0A0K1JEM3_9MICO|nr:hypothetical protein [Luteipulveratus mongoliensis]AKU15151.1 hypothetical protein VV02_03520 [Luteipulveratus mongoliensis]
MSTQRFSRRSRRTLLVLHLLSVATWIGVDVMVAVFVGVSLTSDDPSTVGLCFQALAYVVWPMLTAALATLVTGVLLGWGSAYGVVKHKWVLTKLVINLVLSTLILIALMPGLDELAQRGADLVAGRTQDMSAGDLVYPPIVSLTSLSFAVVLSVFKPWGRTRWGRPAAARTARSTTAASR